MKYALIGCGRIAINHYSAALDNHCEIVGLCDLKPQNIETMKKKLGHDADYPKYTDYKKMLHEQKPELVAIATESGSHAEISLRCIEAGCNVIIEKPIALSMRDANRIIDEGKKKGVLVCACHQNRFNTSIQMIRKALEQGRLGKLLYGTANIRWNRNEDYYKQAPWRGTWAQDGGCLMNQCIHNIDLLRWMMGDEVTEVFAYTDRLIHPFIEAEDLGMALIKFANGSYGVIEGTTNVFPSNLEETLCIFGEAGTIKAGGTSANLIEEWKLADGLDDPENVKVKTVENPPNVYGFGHSKLYADVLDSIAAGKAPLIDGEAGKRALELVLAIYKSTITKRPVSLPLEDFSTLDMLNHFTG